VRKLEVVKPKLGDRFINNVMLKHKVIEFRVIKIIVFSPHCHTCV